MQKHVLIYFLSALYDIAHNAVYDPCLHWDYNQLYGDMNEDVK